MGFPRGRLIQRFLCELYRLDTQATAVVAGGGYDPVFGEPLPVANGTQTGVPSRREYAPVDVPCQVDRREWDEDKIIPGGHDLLTTIILTFHFRDLEKLGLVQTDPTVLGSPKVGPGDLIGSLKRYTGQTVITFPNPPGLVVVGMEEAGFGLNCEGVPQRNLLYVTCQPRRQGEL